MSPVDDPIGAQLGHALETTTLPCGPVRRGKVRDIYEVDGHLILVTTDRVSAFDHVLGTVPFKGEILTRLAVEGFTQTGDIVPNHVVETPDPNVIVARKCHAYPVEFVVRAYLTGSLWRDYVAGRASVYEVPLPADLERDRPLPELILTPTTKAAIGTHDEPISRRRILESRLMTASAFDAAAQAALALFERGRERAAQRGLMLVDTKYEMGEDADGRLTLIDEIHTLDSSRYWVAEDYDARMAAGEAPRMLDKENLRQWLRTERGFTGDGPPPVLDDSIRRELCARYMEGYERILGTPFVPRPGPVEPRIRENLEHAGWCRAPDGRKP